MRTDEEILDNLHKYGKVETFSSTQTGEFVTLSRAEYEHLKARDAALTAVEEHVKFRLTGDLKE